MQNKFPRTFVVTLKETPVRTAHVVKQMEKHGIPHELYFGFYSKSFGLSTNIPFDGYKQVMREIDLFTPYFMTPGQIGCAMTHFSIWKMCQYLPEDEFLILEDDAIPCEKFMENFWAFYESLPADWEIAYLGNQPNEFSGKPTPINDRVATHPRPYTTHAYLFKKSLLPTLIDGYSKLRECIDMYLVDSVCPKVKCYVACPQIVTQKSLELPEMDTKHPFSSTCRDFVLPSLRLTSELDHTPTEKGFLTKWGMMVGEGWYGLEEGRFRWTSRRSKVLLFFESDATIDIKFSCPFAVKISVELSDGTVTQHEFEASTENKLSFKVTANISYFVIESSVFVPAFCIEGNGDSRELGICVSMFYINGMPKSFKKFAENHIVKSATDFLDKFKNKEHVVEVGSDGYVKIGEITKDVEGGKLDFSNQRVKFYHRAGHGYLMDYLIKKHHHRGGLKFRGFIEENTVLPKDEPWGGFVNIVPEELPKLDGWNNAKKLWVFSEDMAQRVRPLTNAEVTVVPYATEATECKFRPDNFVNNPLKLVVGVGHGGQSLSSLNRLNLRNSPHHYLKVRLCPLKVNPQVISDRLASEEKSLGFTLTRQELESVSDVSQLTHKDYDRLLSQNIMFVDFTTPVVHNILVECLIRCTPILVAPLPWVVEYLGKDYPFYFNSLEEAVDKANDLDAIHRAYQYIAAHDVRSKVFLDSFEEKFVRGL